MSDLETRLLASFRARVRALAFTPLSSREAAEAQRSYRNGEENNRLEGLDAAPEDRAFAAMLIEERVPVELWAGLGADYTRALIEARGRQVSRADDVSVQPGDDLP